MIGPIHGTGALGTRLRQLRVMRGLTLRQLAERLSISPSSLSMLENGKCGVTMRRLHPVADFYGVTISELLVSAQSGAQESAGRAIRVSDLLSTDGFVERGKGVWYRLVDVSRNSSLQPFLLRLELRAGSLRDALAHPGEEFVCVLTGTVEPRLGRRSRILKEASGRHFNSSVPHAYRNLSDQVAILIGAATPRW